MMFRRKSCWLPVVVLLCLLATASAQGADGGGVRDVSIPDTGLALRVPSNVVVSPDKPASPRVATLSVEVKTIQSFPKDGVVVRGDVQAQRTALSRGIAKVVDSWEEPGLADIVSLSTGGNAVIYPFYSEFEICDLRFTMNAAFFVGDRRVVLRYRIPPALIIMENPRFFGHDKENCSKGDVWRLSEPDLLKHFHEAVKAGRLGPVATAWYADFVAILASIHQKSPAQ